MFYSINLPFHGKTEWKEGLNFSNEDLQQIIKEILNKDNPKPQTFTEALSISWESRRKSQHLSKSLSSLILLESKTHNKQFS